MKMLKDFILNLNRNCIRKCFVLGCNKIKTVHEPACSEHMKFVQDKIRKKLRSAFFRRNTGEWKKLFHISLGEIESNESSLVSRKSN